MATPLRILAVSFAYPPMAYPRAIQVPRLLGGLDAAVVVCCGSETETRQDSTIQSSAPFVPAHVIQEPFARNRFEGFLDAINERVQLPLWAKNPDEHRKWCRQIFRRFLAWQANSGYEPDLVITFGMPMSDHLFGLACKRRLGLPWIAHFSDPWLDNPFVNVDRLSRRLIRRMERKVVEAADAVVFTSPETVDLVMEKYPPSWRSRAFSLPHICDRSLYDPELVPPADRYVVRYIGSLYGGRSPEALIRMLDGLAQSYPELFDGVSFEFIGNQPHGSRWIEDTLAQCQSIRGSIRFVGRVSFVESIRLMQTANCLLIIDAPTNLSVFLPSKLVDCIGAERFLTAVSPPGATQRVVQEVGGYVADPSAPDSMLSVWERILRERPSHLPRPTHRYDQDVVGAEMQRIIHRVLAEE